MLFPKIFISVQEAKESVVRKSTATNDLLSPGLGDYP